MTERRMCCIPLFRETVFARRDNFCIAREVNAQLTEVIFWCIRFNDDADLVIVIRAFRPPCCACGVGTSKDEQGYSRAFKLKGFTVQTA